MRLYRLLGISLALLLALVATTWAQTPTLDPSILTGKLPDGMTYFIQKNAKPPQRVQMSLLVHAGSVQETPEQRGIAHLLEHLEFDGTEHFGPEAIVNFLESNGMKFGADLNANTGFTATQYYLVIPTDKEGAFETGLKILQDWARGPHIVPSVMENEKKVVLEEARMRMNNVRGRVTTFAVPELYSHSPYADKLPIGDLNVVRDATPELVMGFFHQWYRAPNMAISVVGDLDPQDVLKQLNTIFTAPLPDGNAVPADARVPPVQERQLAAFQDKELPYPEIQWTSSTIPPLDTEEAFERFHLLDRLVGRILETRLSDLSRQASPPFQEAGYYGAPGFGRGWDRTFTVVPYEGKAEEGMKAFVTEIERARVHGFTATDFKLAVAELNSEIHTSYAQRDGITNEDRSSDISQYFLKGWPNVSDETSYKISLRELNSITPEDLNGFAKTALDLSKFRMIVLNPQKQGVTPVTPAQLVQVIDQVQRSNITAAADRAVLPLIETPPKPGTIISQKAFPELNVTEFTLSNGVRVFAKQTQLTPHQVTLSAQRLGGLSLASDGDVLSAQQAQAVFSQTGLGRLSQSQLSDFMSGKQAQVQASVGRTSVGLSGSAAANDLETLFQMVHEQLAPPRRDADAEAAWKKQTQDYLAQNQDLPSTKAANEVRRLLSNGSPRALPLTTARLAQVNLDRAAELYGQWLSDPNGLVMSVVGDFDLDKLKSLLETYVASVPEGKPTPVVDRGVRPVEGPVRSVIIDNANNKADNTLMIVRPRTFHADDRFAANVLREILDIRLREVLRNENGGTYGADSAVSLDPLPYGHSTVYVQFTCEPSRQEALVNKAVGVLKAVAEGKFDDATLAKGKEILVRTVESYGSQNAFWSSVLPEYALRGYDLNQAAHLKELYNSVTRQQVLDLAKDVLDTSRLLQVIREPDPKAAVR